MPGLYCSQYHWLPDGRGRGKVAGHFEHYSYCRNTWAATGWRAEDVSERQVWREGWELCFVPSAIKYSGGVGRTPAVRKWNVEGKSPETWDQFFFFRSVIFLFALVPSRCFECFYRASDARYIQESQCRKTRITFLFVWMDVTIKFLLFFIGIRWNILGCFVFFRSLLHDFAISLK